MSYCKHFRRVLFQLNQSERLLNIHRNRDPIQRLIPPFCQSISWSKTSPSQVPGSFWPVAVSSAYSTHHSVTKRSSSSSSRSSQRYYLFHNYFFTLKGIPTFSPCIYSVQWNGISMTRLASDVHPHLSRNWVSLYCSFILSDVLFSKYILTFCPFAWKAPVPF